MDDVNIDVDQLNEKRKRDDLQFQDIPHDSYTSDKSKVQTHTFTDFPPTAESDEEDVYDKTELLKDEAKTSPSFWSFEYYQQFFDVETSQVLYRIAGSMLPRPGSSYLQSTIRPNPDLYGPFWICTTLVFTTAISGNLANYLSSAGKNYMWRYDFHAVTFAATAIFSYWWAIPALLFGFLWWRGSKANYTFLEILCIYGYSLAVYIPVSILWTIRFDWLQWILVIVGALLSGGVLVLTFWPAVKDEGKKVAWTVIILIFLFHALLAVGFKLYFFNAPVQYLSPSSTTIPTTHIPVTLTLKNFKQNLSQMNTKVPQSLKKPNKPVLNEKKGKQKSKVKTDKARMDMKTTQSSISRINKNSKQDKLP